MDSGGELSTTIEHRHIGRGCTVNGELASSRVQVRMQANECKMQRRAKTQQHGCAIKSNRSIWGEIEERGGECQQTLTHGLASPLSRSDTRPPPNGCHRASPVLQKQRRSGLAKLVAIGCAHARIWRGLGRIRSSLGGCARLFVLRVGDCCWGNALSAPPPMACHRVTNGSPRHQPQSIPKRPVIHHTVSPASDLVTPQLASGCRRRFESGCTQQMLKVQTQQASHAEQTDTRTITLMSVPD
ncbi:hypothetical protein B0T24DRAFT_296680 [Lasiosphaeria ovina]|uniref:Uncharacterized protein n=1 Tax=Lasiosphaeria ovina TaxID=92902 RepID=A0AAE0KE32_9PEZI|nr:hypothetical protein B0T24DRAFT_296680 [Lasiosphaeria ovina]